MKIYYCLLIYGINFYPVESSLLQNCIRNNSGSQTRIFHSLLDYESNRISFNPYHLNFQGNFVKLSSIGFVKTLPTNAFYSFDSEYILKLNLDDDEIEAIDANAFASLICLNDLSLHHNRIEQLHEESFKGLIHLEVLNASNNLIEILPDKVFIDLIKLLILDLSFNNIKQIRNEFAPLIALQNLNLNSNCLARVAGLHLNVSALSLANNSIVELNFTLESSVQHLDVSGNLLEDVNVEKLPRLLKRIELNGNRWGCKKLVQVVVELARYRIEFSGRLNEEDEEEDSVMGIGCRSGSKLQKALFEKNSAILDTSNIILANLYQTEKMLLYLYVLIVVIVGISVTVKLGICRFFYSRFSERTAGYLDPTSSSANVENLVLLRH